MLVLDIAHGHTERAIEALGRGARGRRRARPRSWPATSPRPRARATWSRPARTGSRWASGPGSVCTTRVVAGVGVPQLTAVMECAEACAPDDVPVIADGGIRAGGDVAKAIAAGAETRDGRQPAGRHPGEPRAASCRRNGTRVKVFRGMASAARPPRPGAPPRARTAPSSPRSCPRASRRWSPCATRPPTVLHALVGGLRSGMSYSDARTIPELHRNARFVRITAGRPAREPSRTT